MLRSILWPLAIVFIIHRSYVLATNGYITDDFGPVYRAVVNFKRGWDIYKIMSTPPRMIRASSHNVRQFAIKMLSA